MWMVQTWSEKDKKWEKAKMGKSCIFHDKPEAVREAAKYPGETRLIEFTVYMTLEEIQD